MLDTFIRIAPIRAARPRTSVPLLWKKNVQRWLVFLRFTTDPKNATGLRFACLSNLMLNKYFHHVYIDKDVRVLYAVFCSWHAKRPWWMMHYAPWQAFWHRHSLAHDTEGEDFFFTMVTPAAFKSRDFLARWWLKIRWKQLIEKGCCNWLDEGVAQLFATVCAGPKKIIGCVGELQFRHPAIACCTNMEHSTHCLAFYKACWLPAIDPKKSWKNLRCFAPTLHRTKTGNWRTWVQSEWF